MSNFIGGLIQFVFRIERRAEKIYGYFQQDSFFPIGIFAFFICCLAWKPRKCTPARTNTQFEKSSNLSRMQKFNNYFSALQAFL